MILNLTQHNPTAEQVDAGVVSHPEAARIKELLTFDTLDACQEVRWRAKKLAALAVEFFRPDVVKRPHRWRYPDAPQVMIGGAPFLMGELEAQLKLKGLQPVYAFSTRVSVESQAADGSVTKTNVFKHVGFYKAQS